MPQQSDDLETRILETLGQTDYNPRRSKELSRDLGVSKKAYRTFRDILKRLEREGKLVRQRGGRWALADPSRTVVGRVQIASAGYGFLIPDDPSRDDVFLPEQYLGSALQGDRVKVSVEQRRGKDIRHFGRVLEVIERGQPRIVALIEKDGTARPEDPKNPYAFALTSDSAAVEPDRKVLLEITRWPGETDEPEGRVLEDLGPAGEPDTETAAILASYDAPGPFPEPVKREVANLARAASPSTGDERLDLADAVTVTIDPEDARDFDDALSLEAKPDGRLVLGVHIADVSWFVKPDTRLDEEARDRATSIYLPERVIPMLPEELSNDLCSLRPDEAHLTKSVFLHYDGDGKRTNYTIHRSRIRSQRRFTYEEVAHLLAPEDEKRAPTPDEESLRGREAPAVLEALQGLHRLSRQLRKDRLGSGALELHLPEFRLILDEEGHAEGLEEVPHDYSHQLVEEFMLAANVALAEWCAANGVPALHRIHEPPDEEQFEELAEFLTACGYPFKRPYKRERLKAILEQARGRPEEHAINLAILRSFKQAVYGPQHDIGHFALDFAHYMHFTSPIRRYPDLHLHQMLDRSFSDGAHKLPKRLRQPPRVSHNVLDQLGSHASQRERRAMKIEEGVKDFRRLEFLSRQEQREFKAVVTGIRKFGIFVEIEDYFVEGMIPRWMLARAGFAAREEAPGTPGKPTRRQAKARPGFHLGQEVEVRITKIDLAARLCEMEFLGVV